MSADWDERDLPPAEEIDTGDPIWEIQTLSEIPEPGFFGRIWRNVERRRLSSEVTDFSLSSLVALFLEYLGVLFGATTEQAGRSGGATSPADKGDES